MQTAGHALKQLLIRLKDHGKDHFLIATETSDDPIARHQRTQRPGIHVRPRHRLGAPHLSRKITRLTVPRRDIGHARQFSIQEQKTFRQIIIDILAAVVITREVPQPDARLRPMRMRSLGRGIRGGDRKRDLVSLCSDDMIHNHAVLHRAAEFHRLLVIAEGKEFRGVADGCVMPVGSGGIWTTIGFEIVDADFPFRQMRATNHQPVLLAGQSELGHFCKAVTCRDNDHEQQASDEGKDV